MAVSTGAKIAIGLTGLVGTAALVGLAVALSKDDVEAGSVVNRGGIKVGTLSLRAEGDVWRWEATRASPAGQVSQFGYEDTDAEARQQGFGWLARQAGDEPSNLRWA